MIGLHDHTGSNNHSCVFTHPCPSSYGHGFSNIASLQRSGSPTGCAVLEQTDREESEPDQPTPGGELLVGCSMRRQIACTQLELLSIILIGPTFAFSWRYCLGQYSPQNTQKPIRVAQYSSPSDSASSETLSRRRWCPDHVSRYTDRLMACTWKRWITSLKFWRQRSCNRVRRRGGVSYNTSLV